MQQYIVAFLVSFHVMTFLMIRIIFMPHVVCLAAFLPLERVLNRPNRLALHRSAVGPGGTERIAGVGAATAA